MSYVKVVNGVVYFPYTLAQLKKDNPNVSLPANLTEEDLAKFNVFPVQNGEHPAVDFLTEKLDQASPQLINGKWVEVWMVNRLPTDVAELNVRTQRNRLLRESDWTQGKDISENTSNAWAIYRQELRDLPLQGGFPYSVQWPVAPDA
jgi:hypothetical protein